MEVRTLYARRIFREKLLVTRTIWFLIAHGYSSTAETTSAHHAIQSHSTQARNTLHRSQCSSNTRLFFCFGTSNTHARAIPACFFFCSGRGALQRSGAEGALCTIGTHYYALTCRILSSPDSCDLAPKSLSIKHLTSFHL